MAATLTIRDRTNMRTLDEGDDNARVIEFLTERVTVREIIRARVYQEVTEFNAKQLTFYRGLVQPTDAEKTLKGFKLKPGRALDWEKQFEVALDAFQHNGFFLLVDDRQVTDLEQEIELGPRTQVTFWKLVPLVGG